MIKSLKAATSKIQQIEDSTRKNLYKIANILKDVKTNNLFEEDGYKNTVDYAEKVLGYKRSTTDLLIQVSERFLTDKAESIFKQEDGKDFTVYQLRELLPLATSEIQESIGTNHISPDMSVRKLHDFVKGGIGVEDKVTNTKKGKDETPFTSNDINDVNEYVEEIPSEPNKDEVSYVVTYRLENGGKIEIRLTNVGTTLEIVHENLKEIKGGIISDKGFTIPSQVQSIIRVINSSFGLLK